jgi:serine/threonine protein kinase
MHRDLKCQNIMVTFKGDEKVPSSFTERDDIITRHKDEQKRMEIKEVLISESIMDLDRTNIEKHQFYKNINDNKEFEKISLRSLIKIIDLGFVRIMNEKTPLSFAVILNQFLQNFFFL